MICRWPRPLLAFVALILAMAAILFTPAVAFAQEIQGEDTAVAPVATLTLSAFSVLVLTSLLIPTLTGLVTRLNATATVKQIITALISTIAGVVTTASQIDGTAVISLATLQYAVLSFLIATVGYLGLYKPHQADEKLGPDIGIKTIGPIG